MHNDAKEARSLIVDKLKVDKINIVVRLLLMRIVITYYDLVSAPKNKVIRRFLPRRIRRRGELNFKKTNTSIILS